MRIALAFALAALVGGMIGGCFERSARLGYPENGDRPGISAVVGPCMSSVVLIRSYKEGPEGIGEIDDGSGSGVEVDARGFIVTCCHVVAGSSRLEVDIAPDRKGVRAHIVAQDEGLDVALIQVDERLFDAACWGDSDTLVPGDSLFAVGYPFNVTKACETGIVSATDVSIRFPVITTNAAINPGMSGGGAFDFNGRLIGLPCAIYAAEGLRANTGVAYMIPGNVARRFVSAHLPG